VAQASGVCVPAIARLEQNTGNPRAGTLDAIQRAFEKNGIEFFGDSGVDLRKEIFKIDIFEGAEAIQKIWDDVVATLQGNGGGELLMSGMNERLWIEFYGDKLGDEMKRRFKAGIRSRLLIKEGDNLCVGSDDTYRCVPEAVFGQTPYFVYADKYALIPLKPKRIVLIRSQSVADTFRKQFEFNWKLGTPVKNPKILYPLF
jgi:transcriptional regulator with XRE-family HTH domain